MPQLSSEVSQAWDNREGPAILVTVNQDGIPNAIYATCVSRYDEARFVIADNYFNKTRENVLTGCQASLLFMTEDRKSYQIKGDIEYQTEGEIFENMKHWSPSRHPEHAAAVIKVRSIYSGAKQLI